MLPQFDISTFSSQFFWLMVSFSIVLLGVTFLVLPKYKKLLMSRLTKIKNEVDAAVYLQQELITLKKERLKQIQKTQELAKQEIEDAYHAIHKHQVDTIKKIRKDYELMVRKVEQSIEHQKQSILEHVQPFIQQNKDEILDKIKSLKDVKNAAS